MRPARARRWNRSLAATTTAALAAAAVLFATEAKADVVTDYVAANARIVCLVRTSIRRWRASKGWVRPSWRTVCRRGLLVR